MEYTKGDPVCVTSLKNPHQWHIDRVKEVSPGFVRLENEPNRYHTTTGLEARKGRAEHIITPATEEQLRTYTERQEISRLQNKIEHVTRAWRAVKSDGDQVERLRNILALVEALDASLT